MLKVIFSYSFGNIFRAPLRSFFTLLSITMIITLYIIISGIGDSFTSQLNTIFHKQKVDIIVQSKYCISPLSSSIKNSTVNSISNLKEIKDYGALIIGKIKIKENVRGYIVGVSEIEKFSQRLGLSLVTGRFSSQDAKEIMVAKQLAKILKIKSGDNLALSETKTFKVVGIYESWLGFFNTSIISSQLESQELLNKKDRISMLVLALKDPNKIDLTINKINKNHPSLSAIKSEEFSKSLQSIEVITNIMKIISITTLVIAIAIMLNTFIMAINERAKEIGILLAIGWSTKMVIGVVILESMILSVMGGVSGLILSNPILYLIKQNYANMYVYLPSSLSFSTIIEVIILCLLIAVISVILPAYYGTKINIAEALNE